MNTNLKIALITGLSFSLAACGDTAEEAPEAVDTAVAESTETASAAEDMAKEAVEAVKEALKLDTSSPEAFKESLAAMKASLSDADKESLTTALASLGKKAAGEGEGSMLDKAKDMAASGSMEDTLLKSFGDELDGMTFDDLMAYVNK